MSPEGRASGEKRDKVEPGALASVAAQVLMKCSHAARMARFDLLRAARGLAKYLAKWGTRQDEESRRLVLYKNYQALGDDRMGRSELGRCGCACLLRFLLCRRRGCQIHVWSLSACEGQKRAFQLWVKAKSRVAFRPLARKQS
jgi:hypothetical protein